MDEKRDVSRYWGILERLGKIKENEKKFL